jgi:hypothetical protein
VVRDAVFRCSALGGFLQRHDLDGAGRIRGRPSWRPRCLPVLGMAPE